MNTIALALTILAALDSFAPPPARSVRDRWAMPSRMTPGEAAAVLARQARGDWIAAAELFEAEKHLRTDGPLSVAPFVLREELRKRLPRVQTPDDQPVAWTLPPPVLHWLAVRRTDRGLELRGESIEVAVAAVSSARALVLVERRSIHQDWSVCEEGLCYWELDAPAPHDDPVLSISPDGLAPRSEIRCDGERMSSPRQEGHERAAVNLRFPEPASGDGTPRRIVCSVSPARSGTVLHLAYSVADRLTRAPSNAAPSAVMHNPMRLSFGRDADEAGRPEAMVAIGTGESE